MKRLGVPLPILLVLAGIASGQDSKRDGDAVSTVVARGVGIDAEAAKKDALSNAVQQVVGAYVDAETLVQNESVLREKILTFANADVKKQEVLSVGKEAGLYRVTMRVTIARDPLTARLRAAGIAVRKIDGDAMKERLGELERDSDRTLKQASSLAELLAGCNPVKLWKAEIEGDPLEDFRKAGDSTGRLSIRFRIVPDSDAWSNFRSRVAQAVQRSSPSSATRSFRVPFMPGRGGDATSSFQTLVNLQEGPFDWIRDNAKSGDVETEFLALFHHDDRTADRAPTSVTWDWYVAPGGTTAKLEKLSETTGGFRVVVRLLDRSDGVVKSTEMTLLEALNLSGVRLGNRLAGIRPGVEARLDPFEVRTVNGRGTRSATDPVRSKMKNKRPERGGPAAVPPSSISVVSPFLWTGDPQNRFAVVSGNSREALLDVSRDDLARIRRVEVAVVGGDRAPPRGPKGGMKGNRR